MKTALITLLVLAVALTVAPAARAADDGNTHLFLNSATIYYPNDYWDIVNTSGTGNVKGIRCTGITNGFTMQITVNGGTMQSITNIGDTGPDSGWIPMNLRFTSSIHVKVVNGSSYQTNGCTCFVSWGTD